jgi:hypothetical protein
MKKLIAISVMCALVTGAAFADTTFGGQIFVKGELLNGSNEKDTFPGTGAIGLDAYNTLVKMTFGDTTAGGWLGIHNGNGAWYHGFAWWRPIPQLKLQIGRNQDGDFGTAQISGWGFTGEAKNLVAMPEYQNSFIAGQGRDHSRTTGWYPGISGWALEASLYPAEGLSINLAVPIGDQASAGFTFLKFEAQVQYRLTDIGTVSLSFQSNTGYLEGNADEWQGAAGVTDPSQSPKVFASFYLTAIDGMGVDLGVAYKFPFNNEATKTVTNHPFEIGLGFRYGQGDFGFKLRAGVTLGESTVVDGGDPVDEPTRISVSILPTYKIGANTFYFNAGIGMQSLEGGKDQNAGIFASTGEDTVVSWFVNPYVLLPAGSMRFLVGFKLFSDGVGYPYYEKGEAKFDQALISWAIPIGFYTYF